MSNKKQVRCNVSGCERYTEKRFNKETGKYEYSKWCSGHTWHTFKVRCFEPKCKAFVKATPEILHIIKNKLYVELWCPLHTKVCKADYCAVRTLVDNTDLCVTHKCFTSGCDNVCWQSQDHRYPTNERAFCMQVPIWNADVFRKAFNKMSISAAYLNRFRRYIAYDDPVYVKLCVPCYGRTMYAMSIVLKKKKVMKDMVSLIMQCLAKICLQPTNCKPNQNFKPRMQAIGRTDVYGL